VFGHKKFPDIFCEFITPAIDAKLLIVCTENAPLEGVELKCAVNPLLVWSNGIEV
jgi:hypothetical protein